MRKRKKNRKHRFSLILIGGVAVVSLAICIVETFHPVSTQPDTVSIDEWSISEEILRQADSAIVLMDSLISSIEKWDTLTVKKKN